MDLNSRPGIIRYTLTKHFQDNGLVPDWWFAAINPVLERAVARATGKVRLPSQERSIDYLLRYMQEQAIKELDPTSVYADVLPPEQKKPRGYDWTLENYRQENHPFDSRRWKLLRVSIFKRDGRKCAACGTDQGQMHIDHIKPRSKYPQLFWEPDNLQVLCKACNVRKNRWHETDYRKNGSATKDATA